QKQRNTIATHQDRLARFDGLVTCVCQSSEEPLGVRLFGRRQRDTQRGRRCTRFRRLSCYIVQRSRTSVPASEPKLLKRPNHADLGPAIACSYDRQAYSRPPKLIEQLTEMRHDVKSSQHAEMKASRHYRRSVPS